MYKNYLIQFSVIQSHHFLNNPFLHPWQPLKAIFEIWSYCWSHFKGLNRIPFKNAASADPTAAQQIYFHSLLALDGSVEVNEKKQELNILNNFKKESLACSEIFGTSSHWDPPAVWKGEALLSFLSGFFASLLMVVASSFASVSAMHLLR